MPLEPPVTNAAREAKCDLLESYGAPEPCWALPASEGYANRGLSLHPAGLCGTGVF
jgi:hypothetical protein